MHKYAGNMQFYAQNMQVYANNMQEICTKYANIWTVLALHCWALNGATTNYRLTRKVPNLL